MNELILIPLLLCVILYVNVIRFVELKSNTSMFTLKQYLINKHGIAYTLNIVILFLIFFLIIKYFL